MQCEILMTSQVEEFLDALYEADRESHRLVNQAILVPPSAGRSEIRILFVFDPWRSAILLVAGDKSGQWSRWYRDAIPEAERLYATYLKEREKEIRDERR